MSTEPDLARWHAPLPRATRTHLAQILLGPDVDFSLLPDAEPAPTPSPAPIPSPTPPPDRDDEIGLIAAPNPDPSADGTPLWLRAGTADSADHAQAMQTLRDDLRLPFAPRRIVDLGARQGFLSTALAAQYPSASLISVEADPALTRLHRLNCTSHPRITLLNAGLAASAGTAAMTGHDAETGQPKLDWHEAGPIPVTNFNALLSLRGWDRVDLLIIDPRLLLSLDPTMLDAATIIAIKRDAAGTIPTALRSALPDSSHLQRVGAGYAMFLRLNPPPPCPANRTALIDFTGPPTRCERHDCADAPWAFFPIGETGFRLHPNHGGAPPARLRLHHTLTAPKQFTATVRVAHPQTRPVRFRLTITLTNHPTTAVASDIVVDPGQSVPWQIDLPLISGPAWVEIATEMADPADGNGHAWAEILDPGFD